MALHLTLEDFLYSEAHFWLTDCKMSGSCSIWVFIKCGSVNSGKTSPLLSHLSKRHCSRTRGLLKYSFPRLSCAAMIIRREEAFSCNFSKQVKLVLCLIVLSGTLIFNMVTYICRISEVALQLTPLHSQTLGLISSNIKFGDDW